MWELLSNKETKSSEILETSINYWWHNRKIQILYVCKIRNICTKGDKGKKKTRIVGEMLAIHVRWKFGI